MLNSVIGMLLIPLSGAAIGFFTNWIAIKMLFRPHEEKRLFGIILPFTPGIIPKRRAELAKKLGAATGEHILTNDALTTALVSHENACKFEHHISNLIDVGISNANNSSLTVEEYLHAHIPNADAIITNITEHITSSVHALLLSQTFRTELVRLIHEQLITQLKSGVAQQYLADFLNNNREQLKSFLNEQYMSDTLQNNDTPLSAYLGKNREKLQTTLSAAAAKHLPTLISDCLRGNESLNIQLEALTKQVIDNSLNPLMRTFVNPAKIYASLKENALTFLANEAEVQKLIDSGMGKATTYLELPVSFYASKLRAHAPLIQQYTNTLSDCIIDALLAKCMKLPVSQLIDTHQDKLPDYLNAYAEQLSPALASLAADYIQTAKTRFLGERISTIAAKLTPDDIAQLQHTTSALTQKAFAHATPLIVKSLDISKIVEVQINSFDIAKIEALTLSVVQRELKIIVMLGGVLGFLVGIIVLLLQYAL